MQKYSDYTHARDTAWKLLIECGITELPVPVGEICRKRGWTLASYHAARRAIAQMGLTDLTKHTDGFCVHQRGEYFIFYDRTTSRGRQRFTVAHEIGHIMLGHIGAGQYSRINREPTPEDSAEETQANQFAARILAPAWVLHSIGAVTPDQIARVCDISQSAATFRAERMRELERRGRYLSHPLERQVAQQFASYVRGFRFD